MNSRKPKEPRQHHFVPELLLRRWADDTGRIRAWRREKGPILSFPVLPKETARQRDLYAFEHLYPDDRQWIEREVLANNIEHHAEGALSTLVSAGPAALAPAAWVHWATFLVTMRVRQPEVVARLRREGREYIEAKLGAHCERYEALKGAAPEANLLEWARTHAPGRVLDFGIGVLPRLFRSKSIVGKILRMEWVVADLSGAARELLLSDRPLVAIGGIDEPGHLQFLPLGPRHAFFASPSPGVLAALRDAGPDRIVELCNDDVARQAVRFVYGSTDADWLHERLRLAPAGRGAC